MIVTKVTEGYVVRQTKPHGIIEDPHFKNRELLFEDEKEAQRCFAQCSSTISNLNIFRVIQTLTFPDGKEQQEIEIIEVIK